MPRARLHALLAGAVLGLALVQPAHAWLGALGKLGSAAGKGAASTAGKGAAAGAGAVAGAEAVQGANAAAKVGKAGATAEAGAAATTADDVSRASGLGKAVPDDIAAMLHTPGKTLADVPDAGARSWLGTPKAKLTSADADLMVRDYAALLEGKPAKGPGPVPKQAAAVAPVKATLPATRQPSEIPWYAVELVARAAHLGHKGAQSELDRLCRAQQPPPGDTCRAVRTTAQKT